VQKLNLNRAKALEIWEKRFLDCPREGKTEKTEGPSKKVSNPSLPEGGYEKRIESKKGPRTPV